MNELEVTGIATHTTGQGLCELDLFFTNGIILEMTEHDTCVIVTPDSPFKAYVDDKSFVDNLIDIASKSRKRYKALIHEVRGCYDGNH